MSNVDRNKLRRIDVYVNSYGSNAKWFLETDNFETELIDGQTNVIDFKMDLIKKSRLSSLVDAAKNRLSSLVDAAKNCFCSKDEEQKNKKKVLGLTFAHQYAIILCAPETADSPSARKLHFMDLL